MTPEAAPQPPRPILRIVRGEPDAAELAALAAVVAGLAAAPAEEAAAEQRSAWADRAALIRGPLPHGPGAWRASAR